MKTKNNDSLFEWIHKYGEELNPPPGYSDTFGEGLHYAKRKIIDLINAGNIQSAWVVLRNSDLTEGKGIPVVACVCTNKVTAKNRAKGINTMGSNGVIAPVTVYRCDGWWYGPINLIYPTKKEEEEEKIMLKRKQVIQKAREAGLTDEDIDILVKTRKR